MKKSTRIKKTKPVTSKTTQKYQTPLTNETTNGGSQIGYLKSGLKEDDVVFCFCSDLCTRDIITVFELQLNRDSTNFRFKVNPTDSFTTQSSKNSCTKFN